MHRTLISFVVLASLVHGQTTWTGAASSSWGALANWSAGVPTSATDAIIPSGTPNSPSTSGVASAACRDLTINPGATMTIAPAFPLNANRNVTVSGAIAGGGLLRFAGATSCDLTGAGPIGADVEIAKSAGFVNAGSSLAINGNLTVTSGDFRLSNSPNVTATVTGNALFQGGGFTSLSIGTLDVAGNVTFAGTTVSGTAPSIQCAGNWTANASFAPTGGQVTLDAAGAQSMSGAGGLPNLTIAPGSVTSASALTVNGTLVVNGSLAVSGALDANLDVTVNPGGALDVGGGTDTFARSLTINGTLAATGTLVFDGGVFAAVTSAGPLPSIQIAKSAGAVLTPANSFTVNGNLTVTSGDFRLSNSPSVTTTVTGNALFQGGVFTSLSIGTLDVAGNVTFAGTTVGGVTPTIRCAGNWTADAAFAPTAGLVVCDGSGAQTITGPAAFPDLTIAAGSITTVVVGGLTTNGVLTVNGSLAVTAGALDANGDVTVAAAGALGVGGGTDAFARSLTINGSLTATGTLVFDGGVFAAVTSAGPLPSIQVAKSAGAVLTPANSFTVNGNLTVTSGDFRLSNSSNVTTTVTGNALFQGGVFTTLSIGTLDVGGNVTFAGTTVGGVTPTIRCAGNWTADAAFAPTAGLVVCDGSGAQTITGPAAFPDLTIAAGSITTVVAGGLTTNGVLTVNGSLAAAVGPLDANGDVTVAATGALGVGGGTDTFARSLTINGSLTATGTLVFDGGVFAAVTSAGPLPSIQVAKTGNTVLTPTNSFTVNGNLTVTSGDFRLSNSPSVTTTVTGNALFQGGVFTSLSVGTLDVAGNVTFSGTTVGGVTPTIRCAGNWTADAAFAPTAGLVVCDGSGAQTITGPAAFADLTIAAGSITTVIAGGLTTNGVLTVNGSLAATAGALDANGDVSVAATGALDVGGGTDTFARSLTIDGSLTATGTLVFDGGVFAAVTSAGPLPSIQVAKTGNTVLTPANSFTVNGNLTVTSGDFRLSNSPSVTTTVTGNALFQGGVFTSLSVGTLDVAGNVTFSGTTVGGVTPTIRCAGNWTANAAFAPSGGTVELDGPSPTTIAHGTPGGILTLPTLVLSNGARTLANDFTIAAQAITIAPTGSLGIAGGRHLRIHRPSGTTNFAVGGGLSIAAASELSMGPQTTATVAASGLLSLIGALGTPATVSGEAGGGYGLSINGALAANHFVVKEAGPAGMVVAFGATIAPGPNNLRNGTFDFRAGAPPGSVLLDLRRQAPAADFDGLAFLNTPGAPGTFNVTTSPAGVPISFTNWTGAFSGPSFENDPNGLVAWNLQPAPLLAFFVVRPGAELAELVWQTTSQLGVTAFEIRRGSSTGGPFSVVATLATAGSGYGHVDAPLAANQPAFYLLHAVMAQGDKLLVGSGSTTPYSSATPGNVKKVGGNGTFATIQAAVDAATDPNSVVWVTPGTYPSFTIGATAVPSNLRILGDGTGPVHVDTTSGPIQILNVPATSGVELSDLIVGNLLTAQNGVVVTGCLAPVVLDSLEVSCDGAHTAISVSGSPAMAIQRSDIQGGTGLSVTGGSYVAISRGSLSSLQSTGSTIEMTMLAPGSVNVTPPASLVTRAGLMPDIDLPEFMKLSVPSALLLSAQPNAPFIVFASTRLGFTTGSFEMPALLDPASIVSLPLAVTDAAGDGVVGFELEPNPVLLGFTFVVQVVVGDPLGGAPRLSNVESMVGIP